jgi:hypothetical protein
LVRALRVHPEIELALILEKTRIYYMAKKAAARKGREVQISALVSPDTRTKLEGYVRETGMKKGHVLEHALLIHLEALNELPADIVLPPRVVVSAESGATILARVKSPRNPTPALVRLMKRK